MGKFLRLWIFIGIFFNYSNFIYAFVQSDSRNNLELMKYYGLTQPDEKLGNSPDSPAEQMIKPLGEIKGPLPPECHPRVLESHLIKRDLSAKEFSLRAQEDFSRCEKYWNAPEKQGKLAMLEFMLTEYDVVKNRSIQNIILTMRDGSKVKAYIAIQDKFTRRPWIIAKCGVFCTASDSTSVRNYLIHLFDQSPFNVIFLSNRTGVDYIVNNEKLTLGGYLEAHDYYEVGRWLKEESIYKETVDSLHAFGMSLAGSAAVFVDPLAEAYGYDENNRLFQSVMSFCPVINLKPTIIDMYTNKSKRKLFSKLTWDELQQVKSSLSEVAELLNRKNSPDFSEFPGLMGTIVSHYASIWGKGSNTYRNTREIQNIEDLWELNQFSNLRKEIKTPLLVWASKDDSIVSNEINTSNLMESWVYKNSENLGVLNVNYGNHCAFATSYGFPVSSAIMRSFVLSHSKNFLEARSLHKISYDFDFINFGSDKHLRQWWQAYPNMDYVTISFETHNDFMRPWCLKSVDIYDKNDLACRNQIQIKLPLKVLSEFNIQMPANSTEAEILSRKLNGLLRITENGNALEGSSSHPNQIEWFDYSL
jgi:hypothetical protein